MSTYAISDLHGYPIDKFKALLDKANFSDSDTLYVLGDVIDRNGDGWTIMKYFTETDAAFLPHLFLYYGIV